MAELKMPGLVSLIVHQNYVRKLFLNMLVGSFTHLFLGRVVQWAEPHWVEE